MKSSVSRKNYSDLLRMLAVSAALTLVLLTTSDAAKLRRTPVGESRQHHRHRGRHGGNELSAKTTRGQCAPSGLCCQGKDNNCQAMSASPHGNRKHQNGHGINRNETWSRGAVGGCFCDSACLELGDCCDDYKFACHPVDCVLAAGWDDYGECSSRCGPGIRQRRRRVMQQPLNGGQPCGKTVERVPCDGTNCKVARAPNGYEELRETAYIIPAVYGTWRKSKRYDPFSDIRRNLFEHYDAKSLVKRPVYCMVFELTEVRSWCNVSSSVNGPSTSSNAAASWTNQLVKGSSVCVECQPSVMKKKLGGRCRGHGVLAKATRWDAVTVPGCRGRWVMKSRKEECQCSDADTKDMTRGDFILV